jgi:acyl-CoA thioester hydrolase
MTGQTIADDTGGLRKWPGIAIAPAAPPELDGFRFRSVETLRFADADMNGHVTQGVIAALCQNGRALLLVGPANALLPPGARWVARQLTLDFRQELTWPGTAEIGTAVERLGRSSIRFRQAVLQDGKCKAVAGAVMVLIDVRTRRAMAIPQNLRERLAAMTGAAE